ELGPEQRSPRLKVLSQVRGMRAVEHRSHMNVIAIVAALGAVLIASPAFFIFGRRAGRKAELARLATTKSTAEEASTRIIGDAEREQELEKLVSDERRRLEQMAGMSAQDAKAELVRRMEEEAQAAAANRIREIRDTAKRNADREAKKIVALAIQRIAAEHTAE